jgi:hypothetical protein
MGTVVREIEKGVWGRDAQLIVLAPQEESSMSSDREGWTDAEWADRCRAGDREALIRVAELFVGKLYSAVATYGFQHGHVPPEDVWEALQDLFATLLECPEKLLRAFDESRTTLERYLTRRACRRIEALRRKALCRRRNEARVPVEGPPTSCRMEVGVEERAERLAPRLTPEQRALLQAVLRRTFSDFAGRLSAVALRQIVHRIRQKVREQAAEDVARASMEKS